MRIQKETEKQEAPPKIPTKGNGESAKTVEELEGRRFTKDNWEQLWLLGLYGVQARGAQTCIEIVQMIKDQLNSVVHPGTMSRVLEALRKKDFLAANREGKDRVYSTKKLQYNCSLEIAQVDKLLARLKEDPAGMALAYALEAQPGGRDTGKEISHPDNWATFRITVKLISEIRGGYPYSAGLIEQIKESKFNKTFDASDWDPADYPLCFDRGPNGGIMIGSRNFTGFLEWHLNSAHYGSRDKILKCNPWMTNLFYVEPTELLPPVKVVMQHRPAVQIAGSPKNGAGTRSGGFGLKWFETLPPGTEIPFVFSAPTVNFMTPAELERWLRRCLRMARSSFSPAAGRQTGQSELIKFELVEYWDPQPEK
ncbi:MAG: hypothetical protein MUC88_00210 [Planctomycetes bacterium]|jgi:predicted transcriptional regulator|nr:hypothetical protein [Planctomycetota bacterium]